MILNLSPATGLVQAILGARFGLDSQGAPLADVPVAMFIKNVDQPDSMLHARALVSRIIVEGYRMALADGSKETDSRGEVRLEVPLKLGDRQFAGRILEVDYNGKCIADHLLSTVKVSKQDVVQKILEMGLFHVKLSVEH